MSALQTDPGWWYVDNTDGRLCKHGVPVGRIDALCHVDDFAFAVCLSRRFQAASGFISPPVLPLADISHRIWPGCFFCPLGNEPVYDIFGLLWLSVAVLPGV